MGPLLCALWSDAAFARTFLLSVVAFAVAYYTIDPTLTPGARIAIALGQTFLVGGSSALPSVRRNGAVESAQKIGLVMLLTLAGCATPTTPAQSYFAAKSAYATAGDLVNAWCAQPATPKADCEKVDAAMDKAEAEIAALDAIASPDDSTYELATALLVRALEIAERFVPEVKAP